MMDNLTKKILIGFGVVQFFATWSEIALIATFIFGILLALTLPFDYSKLENNTDRANTSYLRLIYLNSSIFSIGYFVVAVVAVGILGFICHTLGILPKGFADWSAVETVGSISQFAWFFLSIWAIFAIIKYLRSDTLGEVSSQYTLNKISGKFNNSNIKDSVCVPSNYSDLNKISLFYSLFIKFPLAGIVLYYFIDSDDEVILSHKNYLFKRSLIAIAILVVAISCFIIGVILYSIIGMNPSTTLADAFNQPYGMAIIALGAVSTILIFSTVIFQAVTLFKGVGKFIKNEEI